MESALGHTAAALLVAPTVLGAVPYKVHQAMGGKDEKGEKLKTLYEQCNRQHQNPVLSKWCVTLKEALVMSVGSKEAKEQVKRDRENSRKLKEHTFIVNNLDKINEYEQYNISRNAPTNRTPPVTSSKEISEKDVDVSSVNTRNAA